VYGKKEFAICHIAAPSEGLWNLAALSRDNSALQGIFGSLGDFTFTLGVSLRMYLAVCSDPGVRAGLSEKI
jgi:hypothetical protein